MAPHTHQPEGRQGVQGIRSVRRQGTILHLNGSKVHDGRSMCHSLEQWDSQRCFLRVFLSNCCPLWAHTRMSAVFSGVHTNLLVLNDTAVGT
jgi:hypothetical protein